MKIINFLCLLGVIVMIINFQTSHSNNDKINKTEASLNLLYNNTNNIDELIKKTIDKDKIDILNMNIQYLIENNYIECLRKINDDYFYVIFKTTNNNYLVLLYNISFSYYPIDKWYVYELYSSSFDKINSYVTSLSDIKSIDPHGNYNSFFIDSSTKWFSKHYTIDGYTIIVNYVTNESNDFVVENIKRIYNFNGPFSNILLIDKQSLFKIGSD